MTEDPRKSDETTAPPRARPSSLRKRSLRKRAMALLVPGLLVSAAACTVFSGPETDTVRGILRFQSDVETTAAASTDLDGPTDASEGSLEAPDTVRVGETFPVTIRTVGLDGCWAPAGEDVTVEGLTATVVPFDSTGDREGVACTMALVHLDHEVRLAFGAVGEAVVRVEGRRVVGRDGSESEPLALEETVTVVR